MRTFAFSCVLLLSSLIPCLAQKPQVKTDSAKVEVDSAKVKTDSAKVKVESAKVKADSAKVKTMQSEATKAQEAKVKNRKETDGKKAQAAPSTQVQGVQYNSPEEAAAALAADKPMPLFAGVSISADLCGAVMAACTPYGQYEAAARLNFKGRYFPVFEIGIGSSNHTNETTNLHYKINSPYYRIGLDYNVAKHVRALGRIYVGVRYGFSSYKFDVDGPDVVDAVYGTTTPFNFKGVSGNTHWGEAVFGLEARVWGMLHLGWSFRYRVRIHNKRTAIDNAWYIPGYGKNDSHALGGTFNIIFDI